MQFFFPQSWASGLAHKKPVSKQGLLAVRTEVYWVLAPSNASYNPNHFQHQSAMKAPNFFNLLATDFFSKF